MIKDFLKILFEDGEMKSFITFAAVLIFLPGIFLVFVWNRTMFYELDIVKLTCSIISVGMVVSCMNNPLRITALSVYHDIVKRDEDSDIKNKEKGIKAILLKELSECMYITAIEFVGLAVLKILYPNLSVNCVTYLFGHIAIVGLAVGGILLIAAHITNKFKFRKKRKK